VMPAILATSAWVMAQIVKRVNFPMFAWYEFIQ